MQCLSFELKLERTRKITNNRGRSLVPGRRARRKKMAARILKSGPTNAIKRANYPRERGRERGEARVPEQHVFYLRALRERSRSVLESPRVLAFGERSSLNLPACSYVLFFFFFSSWRRGSRIHIMPSYLPAYPARPYCASQGCKSSRRQGPPRFFGNVYPIKFVGAGRRGISTAYFSKRGEEEEERRIDGKGCRGRNDGLSARLMLPLLDSV